MNELWARLEKAQDMGELRNVARDVAKDAGIDVAFMLRLVDSIEYAAKRKLADDVRKHVNGALYSNGL